MKAAVITVSDRAFRGVYHDLSGPEAEAFLREKLREVEVLRTLVPDEEEAIRQALREALDWGALLVLFTGGTGPAPRDVTPEALAPLWHKELPGFGEAMRAASLRETPNALLSRATGGVVGRALVLLLPGNPKAVRVCLEAVWPAVPTALDLIAP